jgi:hypothetical protein
VHFAGTTHGNPQTICIDPLQYPVLSSGAVPLYLSVVKSLFDTCPALPEESEWLAVKNTCLHAINRTRVHQLQGKLEISYMPGVGNFKCKLM